MTNMDIIIKSNLESLKSREKVELECNFCSNSFRKPKNKVLEYLKNSNNKRCYRFCSSHCAGLSKQTIKIVKCHQCNKELTKFASDLKKIKFPFCSRSCAAYYHNAHKTKGSQCSKLEIWIEKQLLILYPLLRINYNEINTINAELDIYIPSLKLAFELNGIFHYEPIFGNKKLVKTQNNDQRKFIACAELGISLCVIDTTSLKYFKEDNAKKFLNIITKLIDEKLASSTTE